VDVGFHDGMLQTAEDCLDVEKNVGRGSIDQKVGAIYLHRVFVP
jgi:hypothetical protein